MSHVPLIPREHLFGNPTRSGGRISPDGNWLSWLAPRDGVMNVWVAPADDPGAARAITGETERPIREYFWAGNSRRLLYVQDKGGDENFLLYGVDVESGAETALTPFENTRALVIGTSSARRNEILVGLNNRDPRHHDVWLLDVETGELDEVLRNEAGFAGFIADDTLTVRMALAPNAAGGMDFHPVVDGSAAEKPAETTALEDSLTTQPVGYTADGATLYWIDSRGRDTAALVAVDTASGKRKVIGGDERADVGGALVHPVTGVVEAWSATYLRTEWSALDPEIGRSLDWLRERLDGDFGVTSRTDADDKWIVWNDPLTAPVRTFIYDRTAQKLEAFYVSRPELEGAPLQPMHPREIAARDGLILPSYLTLPPGRDPQGTGRPQAPVPLVLLVHGGPWARDGYGFNPYHQWLANRGYAVLSVNFRGSTGFGKSFISAGDLQWGRAMHDDLIDAVEWAVAEGIADRERIAIMGGSYGGYATLAGLAFTPQVFACGVDIVGPSNLETLLATIPPYWEPMIEQFHQRMGDPRTESGLAMLQERSPLHAAERIARPLLIGQGANDPRVKQAESDQIVGAMKDKGIPVTYVLFPDEGHGFARPENAIAFNAVTENFLATTIGGRAEPIGDTLDASTAKVVEGAEMVRGLLETAEA